MLSSRELVMQALNFQPVERIPKDLGGMRSTSISAFAYPALVAALGLPPRPPRVEDTWQMLALPDLDVLDALGVDVVSILDGVTNALPREAQADLWHDYDFGGRLPAQVRHPEAFVRLEDGTLVQNGSLRMPPGAFVFDEEHAGQALDLSADLPKLDLKRFRQEVEAGLLRDEEVRALRALCARVRDATDRAVFFNDASLQAMLGIGAFQGVAIFPMLCLTAPDYVHELHEIVTRRAEVNIARLMPEIAPYIDVAMMAADDWGTQQRLFASPRVFRELFLPYYRRINEAMRRHAPGVKRFLHSCGAIYDLIDLLVEAGFEVLNPVQWTAGGRSFQEWKARTHGRLALWGGGVNAQRTLALGTVDEVTREVREVVSCFAQGSGYVFCNIHNILAEIPPEKVLAMYRAADEVTPVWEGPRERTPGQGAGPAG
jgi:uroporphyrinogen decarboxylase